jgi:prephenate dehydrogenase
VTDESSPIGIVGLGLIGGSIARDLVRLGVEVVVHDRDGALARETHDPVLRRLRFVDAPVEVMRASLVVIAVPVGAAGEVLRALAPAVTDRHVLVDVGSTKRDIIARAHALGIAARFVGCHPLAGDHRSGWAASRQALFTGAPVSICPAPETGTDAVETALAFWRRLGGCVEIETADAHDARMAYASHLPHAASVALALALGAAGVPPGRLGPGGRDVARLAGGSPVLWRDILLANRDSVIPAIRDFEAALRRIRETVESADLERMETVLAGARDWSRG